MTRLNDIEKALQGISGGPFQKLAEAYLNIKFHFNHLVTLGSEFGSDNVTKGIPDAHSIEENGVVLAAFTTTKNNQFKKLKEDITDCLNSSKTGISDSRITKIICCHTCSRLTPSQEQELKTIDRRIELIGPSQIAHDLDAFYPALADEHLGIKLGDGTLCTIQQFKTNEEKRAYTTPHSAPFKGRDEQLSQLVTLIEQNEITILKGASGTGKTRLGLEACDLFSKQYHYQCLVLESRSAENAESDIISFLSHSDNTIVLVDDANELTALKTLMHTALQNPKLKLLLTVRDYAAKRVEQEANDSCGFKSMSLPSLDNETIERILSEGYGITNYNYLKQIQKIAHGNIRLAIMAGMLAKKDGFSAITDSYSIMNHYFHGLTTNFSAKNIKFLEILSCFNISHLSSGHPTYDILVKEKYTASEIRSAAKELSNRSIVDICTNPYTDELAIKFEQQNLRDYLVYRCFFEDNILNLTKYISSYLVDNRQSVIRVLNTMTNIFYSQKLNDRVKESCTDAWLNAGTDTLENQKTIMSALHPILDDYALSFAKILIQKSKACAYWRDETAQSSNSLALDILSARKNTSNFATALPLLITCLQKGITNKSAYKNAFDHTLNFTEASISHKFTDEIILIQSLTDAYHKTPSNNLAYAVIKLTSNYLKTDITLTEFEGKGVSIRQLTLPLSSAIKNLHHTCILALFTILSNAEFHNTILKTLIQILPNFSYLAKQKTSDKIKAVKYDLSEINKYTLEFINPRTYMEYSFCWQIKKYCDLLEIQNHIGREINFSDAFLVATSLIPDTVPWSRKKYKPCKKILTWTSAQFTQLFEYLLAAVQEQQAGWTELSFAVDKLFEGLFKGHEKPSISEEVFLQTLIMTLGSRRSIPVGFNLIPTISTKIGSSKMHSLIQKSNHRQPILLNQLDECVATSNMSETDRQQLIKDLDVTQLPIRLTSIKRIENKHKGFAAVYCEHACTALKNAKIASRFFYELDMPEREANLDFLEMGFSKNLNSLEDIFLANTTSNHFDLKGTIFCFLVTQNGQFASKFVEQYINESDYKIKCNQLSKIKQLLALGDTRFDMINTLLKTIIDKTDSFSSSEIIQRFFTNSSHSFEFLEFFILQNIQSPIYIQSLRRAIPELPEEERNNALRLIIINDKNSNLVDVLPLETYEMTGVGNSGFIPCYEKEIIFATNLLKELPPDPRYLSYRQRIKQYIRREEKEMNYEKFRLFDEDFS
ncbi:ATP-binding protein [Bifidobacterium sp. ESL0763]|uniref:ATP-binding protein n=1 Tax=Bifidobacterium sp. ESL0763 TaxID=2983227 RepID=UPI0023FA3D9C|nr:ATP-binding protein [Bifidobacterium sp. ESL0763]MDF7663550.1 ATP-binding protein [Bifidobacterium sp. ESL0763]